MSRRLVASGGKGLDRAAATLRSKPQDNADSRHELFMINHIPEAVTLLDL